MSISRRELGRRLRNGRRANHVTQAEAAEALGVPRSSISQMESGNRNISGLELHRLARLYGQDIREFLREDFTETAPITALFRSHPDVSLDTPAKETLVWCAQLQRHVATLRRMLGMERGLVSVPSYSPPVPKAKWDAVRHGGMAAAEERRRLDLGNAPLPDVTDLLEAQGISTAQVSLPNDISGLTLVDDDRGVLVVANRDHHLFRRRFSFAHEYAHVLLDRSRTRILSHVRDRADLMEVRANAFAAAFLMPKEGVHAYVRGLEKGHRSRAQADNYSYDEVAPIRVERRFVAESQELQMHDVVRLADHFRVSCTAMLYRLKDLQLLSRVGHQRLVEDDKAGATKTLRRVLDLPEPNHAVERTRFRSRFLGLVIEAFARGKISLAKLDELGALVDVPDLSADLSVAGLLGADSIRRQDEHH